MLATPHRITVGERAVSALALLPARPRALYLFAHGAGAGMQHGFMQRAAELLAEREVATLRYQFPYTEAGKRRPDPPALLRATVRAAAALARELAEGAPLVAGGKSMGGRMTSEAQAAEPLPGVAGLAFFGFPLHPAKQPATKRATHLARVAIPMLFLQGDRDDLADLALLRPILAEMPRATLHVVAGADHAFKVPARARRSPDDVLAELCDRLVAWLPSVPGP